MARKTRPRRSGTRRPTEWHELVNFTRYPTDASSGERLFMGYCDWFIPHWPKPYREELLWPGRKRQADFYWPDLRLAVEIEGGAFSQGRHTRGLGFTEDIRKYNDLVGLGIWLLRFTPELLKQEPILCQTQLTRAYEQIMRRFEQGGSP